MMETPITPPIFHLFGSGFGKSGSNLYFGAAAWPCAPVPAYKNNTQTPVAIATAPVRTFELKFCIHAPAVGLMARRRSLGLQRTCVNRFAAILRSPAL